MKCHIVFFLTLSTALQAAAQQGFPKYYELVALWPLGDSAFRAGDYKKAELYFEKASEIPVEKGIDMNYEALRFGAAVFTQNDCNGYENPVCSVTAYLLREQKLFPIQSLISNFDQLAAENEVIAYYQSAAVFKYLYGTYGVEKMNQLWLNGLISLKTSVT